MERRNRLPITDPASEWSDRARELSAEPFFNDELVTRRFFEGLNSDPLSPSVRDLAPMSEADMAAFEDERSQDARASRLGLGISDLAKLDRYVNMVADPLSSLFGVGRAGTAAATAAQAGAGYLKEDPLQFWGSLALAPGALKAARAAAPAGVAGYAMTDASEAQAAPLPSGFFSPLMELAKRAKMKSAPGSEWAGYLRPGRTVDVGGVKWPLRADEVEHSGLFPLFQREERVDQGEILAALEGRPMPSVKELGRVRSNPKIDSALENRNFTEYSRLRDEALDETNPTHYSTRKLPGPTRGYEESLTKWDPKRVGDGPSRQDVADWTNEDIRRWARFNPDRMEAIEETFNVDINDTEGLRRVLGNYVPTQELFPEIPNDAFIPFAGHFASEPNILSHSRASARTTPDGKKVRLVEELQSDWHQQARDQGGYRNNEPPRPINVVQNSRGSDWFDLRNADGQILTVVPIRGRDRAEEVARSHLKPDERKPPRAPYSDTYHELELRKQLLRAVEEGDDYLALTTGNQQLDRYNNQLQARVDRLDWKKDESGKYSVKPYKSGAYAGQPIQEKMEGLSEAELRRLIGHEMAAKIAKSEGSSGSLAGEDFRVGGTGMRLWYDEKAPAYLKRLSDALGGEITTVKVPHSDQPWAIYDDMGKIYKQFPTKVAAEEYRKRSIREEWLDKFLVKPTDESEQPALKITLKMRTYIKQHGLPLFSAAGASLFGAESASRYLKNKNGGT